MLTLAVSITPCAGRAQQHPPQLLSLSPVDGQSAAGVRQTFVAQFRDTAGDWLVTDIKIGNNDTGPAGVVWIWYNGGALYLNADDSNAPVDSCSPGDPQGKVVVNRYVRLYCGESSVTFSGDRTEVTMNVVISFTSVWGGTTQSLSLYAKDAGGSVNLQKKGNWSITSGGGPVPIPTATPTPGGAPLEAVVPNVTCVVDNRDGSFTAWFGYYSYNAGTVTIPVGTSAASTNLLSKSNGSQPTQFRPASSYAAFSVDITAQETVTWTVQVEGQSSRSASANMNSPSCSPVRPIIECVDLKPDGGFTAHLGYQNSNAYSLRIPAGAHNSITPGPADQGQPLQFLTGRLSNVAAVAGAGSLIWRLGPFSVTASNTSPLCQSSSAPICSAGGPYRISCASGAAAALDGSGSSSAASLPLSYSWTTSCASGRIDRPSDVRPSLSVTQDSGGQSCAVSLTVSDGSQSSECRADVSVAACTPCAENRPADVCGVCGGDGRSCLDCKGVPFGGAKVDRCGACGGDGTSCAGCIESRDAARLLAALTTDTLVPFLKQQNRALLKFAQFHSGRAAMQRAAKRREQQAEKAQKQIRALVQGVAAPFLTCSDPQACKVIDLKPVWTRATKEVSAIGRLISTTIKTRTALGDDPRAAKRKNQDLVGAKLKAVKTLPRFQHRCG